VDDLISRKFGRLTVLDSAGTHISPCGTKRKMWKCVCECGNEVLVNTSNLLNGTTKSCGCWKTDKINTYNSKHNGSNDRLYAIWRSMKRRCSNQKDSHYRSYGGRGITVCEEWANSYSAFKKWAYENGYDESAETGNCTIDRIDNNSGYSPDNCRFVDRIVQANNTSTNRFVEFQGHKMTIAEFARYMNIDRNHARYYVDKFDREVGNVQSNFKRSGD